MARYFSNEIVFRGHPDKVSDQISDALLTAYLAGDPNTRAGIEVCGGKGTIFVTGEVTSNTDVDVSAVVHRVLTDVGYDADKYMVINNIGRQSSDIAQGVDVGGAGDQGMMYGYACCDTDQFLPTAVVILQELSQWYDDLRRAQPDTFFADGKAQITGCYEINPETKSFELVRIKTFTISYQNAEKDRETTDALLRDKATEIAAKYGVEVDEFLINPTGKFLIGGFDGDAGLTGRKIVVDAYHSFAHVGGGAFSGKDSTKVDRSAAYKARQLAIRAINDFCLNWAEVQLSYAIGVAEPLAIYIDSDRGAITPPEGWYKECTPAAIIEEFDLRNFNFEDTAKFGHFGYNFPWEVVEP